MFKPSSATRGSRSDAKEDVPNDEREAEEKLRAGRFPNATVGGYARMSLERQAYHRSFHARDGGIVQQPRRCPSARGKAVAAALSSDGRDGVKDGGGDAGDRSGRGQAPQTATSYDEYEQMIIDMMMAESSSGDRGGYGDDSENEREGTTMRYGGNSLARKLAGRAAQHRFWSLGGLEKPRRREIALRDPYFSTHYKQLPNRKEEMRDSRSGGAHAPRDHHRHDVGTKGGDNTVTRSGRELHLEVAVEAAHQTIERLSSRLAYMKGELDSRTEEVCALRTLLERERSEHRQKLVDSNAMHAHAIAKLSTSVSGIRAHNTRRQVPLQDHDGTIVSLT